MVFMRLQALAIVCLLMVAGCDLPRRKAAPPAPAEVRHTVIASGETLGQIAQWYTGNTENWQKIAAANGNLDPRRIRIGDVIVIPGSLVVRREPLGSRQRGGERAKSAPSGGAPTPTSTRRPAATTTQKVVTPPPTPRVPVQVSPSPTVMMDDEDAFDPDEMVLGTFASETPPPVVVEPTPVVVPTVDSERDRLLRELLE